MKPPVSNFPVYTPPKRVCRILLAKADQAFSIAEMLTRFARVAEQSSEFQGHGWGCAWLDDDGWQQYHNIQPVWKDDFTGFAETRLLLVHARSAFRDEGIVVENNMPFSDGESVFIFNGELRGVRINAEGRIGAEKIYNYIRRFDKGDKLNALERAVGIIKKRSSYIRAMNILLSDGKRHFLSTNYSEDPAYFQMHAKKRDGLQLVCSQPFDDESDWQLIENNTTIEL
ncbi:MAG: putative glutamine amidotransferase [Gammaproteobacteria bacterium]|jgi:predicted glutamine amidotransferase